MTVCKFANLDVTQRLRKEELQTNSLLSTYCEQHCV